MKPRKKAILTAAAVTALFSAGGCGNNEVQNVYGPPPDDHRYHVESVDVQSTESTELPETVDAFDPEDNKNADVYGPPPAFEETTETFAPEMNIMPTVYGPPEWFDETSETSEVYVTDDSEELFDPEDNKNADVYGPPEWFYDTSESEETNETEEISETDEPLRYDSTESEIGVYKPEMNITPCVYGPPEWFATREAGTPNEQEE